MNKTVIALLTAAAATLSMGAYAADELTHSQADALKDQSNAQYKADKKMADANLDVNKADCKTEFSGGVKRACKADAKAQAKQDKADAKLVNKAEKADINSNTK